MLIKKKHIQVVFFSSLIIITIFATTLVGYSLYIQWKGDSLFSRYQHSIYKLTAEIFQKDIVISDVKVKIENDEISRGLPLIEGNLKNNTNKTVTSILIKVSFLEPDGSVLYNDWFYPLGGGQYFAQAPIFSSLSETRNLLSAGETLTFRRRLRNCPPRLVSKLSNPDNRANVNSQKDKVELAYSITGLSVL